MQGSSGHSTNAEYVVSYFVFVKNFVAGENGISTELSLYPVHLIPDKTGNLPPSALVPFCSYQGEDSILGQSMAQLDNLTVCDKFKPTVLEDQLCYSLDVQKMVKNSAKSGKANGLFLLLDPNPYQPNVPKGTSQGSKEEQSQKFTKVFIHTLAQYATMGGGSYMMSALKKMTATESFKQLPDHQKKCAVHNREECQTKKYLVSLHKKCNCMPWGLLSFQNQEQVSCCRQRGWLLRFS